MENPPEPVVDDKAKHNEPGIQVSTKNSPKRSTKKIKILALIGIGIIFLIGIGGAFWLMKDKDREGDKKTDRVSEASVEIPGGRSIPEVDCEKAKTQVGKSIFGDKCYEAKLTIAGETITYIVVAQSEENYERREAECEIDCGTYAGGLARSDFIIRGDGSVENISDGGLLSDISVEMLTGCKGVNFLDVKNTGEKLVKKNGRFGVGYNIKNAKFTDQFGNSCTITTEFSTFVIEPATIFDVLNVRYDLKDPASCDTGRGLSVQACYENQAALRNDIALCDKADFGPGFYGNAECISGVATRNREITYCGRISDENQKSNCERDVTELIEEFKHARVVYD